MLALIAGRGALPAAVAAAQSDPPLVCALDGFAPDALEVDITFRLETLGSLLADLRARGVTRACLCGAIRRPGIDPARIDGATKPLVPTLQEALAAGDDGALRAVIGLFEAEGITVLAAHEAAPGLLMGEGVPTYLSPPASAERDAGLAEAALAEMGRVDLGQACIVVDGRVVAREDEAGTDAMLAQLSLPDADADPQEPLFGMFDAVGDVVGEALDGAADWLSGPAAGRRGLLFKAPKPGQDRRADLPTIGPGTVAGVARAALAGIVIEADGVIVLNRAQLLADMDRAGLFLWSRKGPA